MENVEIIKNEEAREALDCMCKRCNNYVMCNGTGCQPKKTIMKVIEESEIADAYIKFWSDVIEQKEG